MGTECGRQTLHPNIWINALFADYTLLGYTGNENQLEEGTMDEVFPNWIITDVRFPDEVKAIESRGGIVIRLERDMEAVLMEKGIHIPKHLISKEHESETALDNHEFEHVIENDGSVIDLVEKVKKILYEAKEEKVHTSNKE